MTKLRSLCIIALLLFFALTCTARPDPASSHGVAPVKDQNANFEGEVDNCEGVGEEECLMRRTLTAHLDYIYTQKHDKP